MIEAFVAACALDRDDIERLFNHTDHAAIAPIIATNRARLDISNVETDRAELYRLFHVADCVGQLQRDLLRGSEQIERQALRRLGPDARQPSELLDESGD